jgi:hypothetical protein
MSNDEGRGAADAAGVAWAGASGDAEGALEDHPADNFSREWTDRERLAVVIAVTSAIRADLEAGNYNAIGRANLQSVHELIAATPAELEANRGRIDAIVDAYGRARLFQFVRREHVADGGPASN